MEHLPSPVVPISWGELIDKITILEIKRARISGREARANVEQEHALLSMIGAAALESKDVASLSRALHLINEKLWDVEDAIRKEETKGRFGAAFIRLARSVYKHNDERAAIKRRINAVLHSELIEEKSYAGARCAFQPGQSGPSSSSAKSRPVKTGKSLSSGAVASCAHQSAAFRKRGSRLACATARA